MGQPVVYVDQNENPVVPPQEQQKVVVVTQQPAVGIHQPEEFHGDDDPQCLHVLASLFHSLVSLACAVTNAAKTSVPNKRRHSKLWLDALLLASSLVSSSW